MIGPTNRRFPLRTDPQAARRRGLLAASIVALSTLAGAASAAPPNLAFETDSGIEVSVPWYLQWQWSRADADNTPIPDAFGFRRARIALDIERAGVWDFKAEYDWEAGLWTDLVAGFRVGPGNLRVGQYRMPLGLEQGSSNRDAVFLERGLPNALVYARRLGVGYEWVGQDWSLRAAAFGRNLARTEEVNGAAIRGTWAPINGEGRVLHLGIGLGTEDFDGKDKRFNARPDVALIDFRPIDTGPIREVNRIDRLGLEAAWVSGPWSLQSEYVAADIDARAGEGTGDGWYVMATWSATGESRVYRDGLFLALKPSRPWGAVEFGARVGTLDLDDGFLDGGELETITFVANWYVNPALRISANVVDVDGRRRGNVEEPRIYQLRVQTQF